MFKSLVLKIIFSLNFLILILCFILIYIFFGETPPPFLALPFQGILIKLSELYGVIFLAAAVFLINLFLANFLFFREKILSFFFGSVGLIVAFFTLFFLLKIISLN